MFFLSLALLGQTATLDADTGKASRQCIAYFGAALTADFGRHELSQISYFAMAAAKAEGATGDFMKRFSAIMHEETQPARAGIRGGTVTAAACSRRFPLAGSTVPATLPADPKQRDLLCMGMLSYLAGATDVQAGGRPSAEGVGHKEFRPYLDRFAAHIAGLPEVATKASYMLAINAALRGATDVGNPETISASCKQVPA